MGISNFPILGRDLCVLYTQERFKARQVGIFNVNFGFFGLPIEVYFDFFTLPPRYVAET